MAQPIANKKKMSVAFASEVGGVHLDNEERVRDSLSPRPHVNLKAARSCHMRLHPSKEWR